MGETGPMGNNQMWNREKAKPQGLRNEDQKDAKQL